MRSCGGRLRGAMKLRVEVVCALARRQRVVRLELEEGATAADAVRASALDLPYAALGMFGNRIQPETALKDGDRVELLRSLLDDPKEARRRRAARARARGAAGVRARGARRR